MQLDDSNSMLFYSVEKNTDNVFKKTLAILYVQEYTYLVRTGYR
jgi:hypothetical protein